MVKNDISSFHDVHINYVSFKLDKIWLEKNIYSVSSVCVCRASIDAIEQPCVRPKQFFSLPRRFP